jgi:AcrR family transcriptional regulator
MVLGANMATQQRGEETRNRILDAAGALFAQSGYDATGIAEICEQAGVTKGAFYHHFTSKQDVFLELRDRWLSPLDTQLALTRAENESLPQVLQRIADTARPIFEWTAEDRRQQIFLELLSAARHDSTILPAMLAPTRKYRKWIAQLIEAGVREGALRKVDRELAAQVIVSLGVGLVMQSLLDARGADWADVLQRGVGLLLKGLEKPQI